MTKRILSMALAVILLVSMSIPTLAAETKDIKITADYGSNGKFTYSIPGVSNTRKMTFVDMEYPDYFKLVTGKEVNVYTIKPGAKISLEGAAGHTEQKLRVVNGKLDWDGRSQNWAQIVKEQSNFERKVFSNKYMEIYGKGSYISIEKEGYYLFAQQAFVSQHFVTDPRAHTFGTLDSETTYHYSAVVLHVTKDGAAVTNTDEPIFELNKLRSAVRNLSNEFNDKKLIDSRLTSLNNQLTYLNKEIAAGKKPENIATVRTALKDADDLMNKIDISKLSVYSKAADTNKKTDKAELDKTQQRLDRIRTNLDRAIKAVG